MKVINLEQGSTQWLNWRKSKVTASKIGAIMGTSPYQTPNDVYEEMIGDSLGQPPNFAMQRGLALEPIARQIVSKTFELDLQPLVVEHDEISYLAASLDGFDKRQEIVWENKAPGKQEHSETETKGIPSKYFFQCHMQLFITGAKKLLYTTINDNHEIKHTWLLPDLAVSAKIQKAALDFYTNLQNRIPPALTEKDYVVRNDDAWKAATTDYLDIHSLYEEVSENLKRARLELIRQADNKRTRGHGISIYFKKQRNPINYEKLCSENNIDSEKYRTPGLKTIPTVTVDGTA